MFTMNYINDLFNVLDSRFPLSLFLMKALTHALETASTVTVVPPVHEAQIR